MVKSHSPQCVSVLLSVQYLGCLTPGYVRPRPRLPSRMRLSGSQHAVVYRHSRDKDLFSALIFNTIFVAVSTACLLIGEAMVVNANLGTKWLHCVSRLGPSLLAHRGHTQLLASRAANEGSRRSRKVLQSRSTVS